MKNLKVKGFLSDDEIESVSRNKSQTSACAECGLYKHCKSPRMEFTGRGRKRTLIIAEMPGREEDEQNQQLIGKTGRYFRNLLDDRGLDLDEDFWKTNSVICYSKDKPSKKQLSLCRDNYLNVIDEVKPDFIWLLGKYAIESFFSGSFSEEEGTDLTPTRWRALCIPDPYTKAWVIPLFHPSYAMRNENDASTQAQYERDLDFAISCWKREPYDFPEVHDKIFIMKDFEEIEDNLLKVIKHPPEFFFFDYETTGLKPYNKGHRIASVSFCYEDDRAFSLPLHYPFFDEKKQKAIELLWKEVLQNDSKKIAHNQKFEEVWSRVILNVFINNWHWCTMNAAHIIDNRKRYSGLKFQAFIRWGIGDYASKINPYLKSKGDFNKVMKAPLDDLLLYGGIDSLLGYRLFKEQCKEIEDKDPVFFFVDGLISFANMEINGICADRKYYEEVDKKLEDEIVTIYKELHTSEEAKLFKASRGREINFNSDYDLRDLFFKIQDFEPSKYTETKLPSVDAEALHALKSPTAEKIIHLSKIDKVKGTYIGQFLREINEDGKIHPFFDLHPAVSFRGGVHLPNFQNLPKRDEEAERYSRSGVYPSPGNIILDWDFNGMEIRVLACVSKDKMLIKKIKEGVEMHSETASWVYDLDIKRVSKKLRFYSKNGFFFPEVYGSYYANCAKNIWDACKEYQLETADGENIFDHLLSVGIIKRKNDYEGFENHLREVEKDFWSEYSGIKKWQENTQKFYDNHGYIELVTGFKCSGFMSRNQLFNFPIQGPAFHCLIYCIIEIDNYIIDEGLKSKIIAQIHDNLIFDCYPPEKMKLIDVSKDVVYNRIAKDWKWIIVPLDIEIEETEINGSWISKKEVKI